MKEKILNLSKNYFSLEISRVLHLPLADVEKTLIEEYYNQDWKITEHQLLSAASKIYLESPTAIAGELQISEITLKTYLNQCRLHNSKQSAANTNTVTNKSEVCKEYSEGSSIESLCIKHNVSKKEICKILKTNNISTNKVTFEDSLFNMIDSEEKAYWLGFLYADGGVYSGERRNGVEIALKLLDVEHLFKCKTFFKSRRPVRIQYKGINRCRITLVSKKFKQRLIELGCTPQKSCTLKFPTEEQIPKEYIIPFIRGYFDGDGVFSYTISNKVTKTIVPNTGMLGTEDFLQGVFKHLPGLQCTHTFQANKDGDPRIRQVSWSKNDSIYILNTLYNDANIYLTRKYQRYLFFKNNDFAVLKSDFKDNDRTISEKAKQFIYDNYNIDLDNILHANTEITEESKGSSES